MRTLDLSKDKYQIPRKSDFICLTILLHDLKSYHEELTEEIKDIDTLTNKLRYTRNVFVSLHNLKDCINRIRIDSSRQFIKETRALKRELEFIVHIRNKGVGHLDKTLLERAAQWIPEIFYEDTQDNNEYVNFYSYKAVMESTINSYLNEEGQQKVFKTEIDFTYPPDAKQFFSFLSDIVNRSILWLESARKIVKSDINFHSNEQIKELSAIAGQTNFNLKDESTFVFTEEEMRIRFNAAIEKMQEIGADEKIIEFLEKKLFE